MPWYMLQVPENIKKRACIYLLQRYLGQFFEEKLTLDQLSVDLYNGTGTVKNISLDVQALNELGEKQNWPMEFVDGYVEELFVSVPWGSLLKDSSFIEVRGLKITVQPKQRNECATSMFESMWSSMTNSMQLAEECVKQDPTNPIDSAQPLEVIERFAQTIDSILSRVKVKFSNSLIQIEHVPKDSCTGVAMQINIPHMEYMDAAGDDPPTGESLNADNIEQNKAFIVSSFTIKNFYFQGVTLSTVEFPSRARTFSRSVIYQSTVSNSQEKEDSFVTMIEKNLKAELNEQSPEIETEVTGDNVGERSRTPSFSEFENERHVIQFGRLVGKQQISVRLKQSEEVQGPKVSLTMELGSLILFLSPRQVHVLLELANGLGSPDTEDTSNVSRQKCVEKPMSGLDYQRIEQELQQNIHPSYTFQSAGLQGIQGWSTAALEESDSDENYLPMQGNTSEGGLCDSTLSGITSSMESSLSSSLMSSIAEHSTKSRRRVSNLDSDPTAEISHFKISIASLALVILHEDILTLAADQEQTLLISSVRQMQNTSELFFSKLGIFGNKDFESAKSQFEKACSLNHLRLLAAPLHIEANETTTLSAFSISGKLTVAKLELLECLHYGKGESVEYISLLCFNESSGSLGGGATKPSLKLAFKHVEKSTKTAISRLSSVPKTELTFTLEPCVIEIDITIVDRTCALLNPQPICVIQNQANNVWTMPSTTALTSTPSDSRIDFKITSPCVNLKLRFPIPDFRPVHDMQRNPWWKRHVRSDYAVIVLHNLTTYTNWYTSQPCQKYVLQCSACDIHYVEADTDVLLPIARVSTNEKHGASLQDGFNWPRLVLKIYPKIKVEMELEQKNETEPSIMNSSIYGALDGSTDERGPFSAKRIVHESDTPHYKHQQEDTEELVMPGDKQEMSEFIELTTQSARIQLEISLPSVSMQFVSKHIYELIYNRINNDLLLWEPSSPKPKPPVVDNIYTGFVSTSNAETHEMFSMCRSGIKFESDSDSDDDDIDPNMSGIFYSTYDRTKQSQKQQLKLVEPKGQSYLALNLHIGVGVLCMNVPVRDLSTNVIPGQHAEFLINVEDATIFSVTGYQGNDNLGFVCVQANNAQLYHCDMISTPSQSPPLKEFGSSIARHLYPTIYKSEPGVLVNVSDHSNNRDMISLAVRIQANHETHHVKTVRIALGISKATLRHRVCQEPNSWITQVIDVFNVLDYPIPGYHAKDILTELHLHVWDCAIDYRPLYLPIRSVVTMGSFTMSSHLSAQANTSTLRFIFEDCALFLSEKGPPKSGVSSLVPVDLRRDYVNVIDVGLFELSLKTNDKISGINPHFDLRASNNIVHIRTCADSGRALTQLITYFASDGDLLSMETNSVSSTFSSPRHQPEQELIPVEPQDISNLSKSQHQQVNDLLGEAMKESVSVQDEAVDISSLGAKMFFFPDEGNPLLEMGKPLPQVTRELGDVTFRSNKSSDTDDDFCFVGDEAGLGFLPKNGVPEIRWLTDDPLRVIDNHFSIPIGKTDLLKPPKNYPTPIMRYTLCEMSVIWHMYGGNDFKPADSTKQKKTVNFSDLRDSVCYSNTRSGEVIFTSKEKKKSNFSWQIEGGANRDHDTLMELQLNKVRFQHEVYPDNTVQASRQVLIVSELEVRDRLASSQINKFLYQYTSQARPKQSHAHMIVVKAIHIRPDPKLKTQECCLKISLLPLRLNIDQDSLLFLISFFNELSGNNPKSDDIPNSSSKHSTPTHQPPIMTVKVDNQDEITQHAQKMVDDNLLILLEENKVFEEKSEELKTTCTSNEESPPVYFRNVIFSPEVPIRLDYQGKRVDMTHGPLPGLLMGLGQLNCSELRLKRLSHRHGLLGIEKLVSYCLHEWLQDIKKNQLPSLLGGVGPMHSVVQLFQGIRDLFWLPIEQYQKDGRIVRGLQRGANSFTTSTAMAALELTSRIIHLIQITAETAYDMVSPGPSVRRKPKTKGRKKRYAQPQDIREGMANAYMLVKEGIGETADNLVRVASHEHEQKGYSGAVGGVLRQIPPTVVKPIIIATEATNNLLGGMQSQLVPDARREAKQKWRSDDDG